jgi:hypothetical protein
MVSGEFTWIRLWLGLAAFAAAFVIAAVLRRAPRLATRLSRGWNWVAERPGRATAAAALAPVALRLALLPAFPAPVPVIHDEFSHLLLADTLRHGRLANPPHPFAGHFEVAHVIQQPTYASVYPPGPGASLALGWLLFGHPWAGVLLTCAAMCGACCWMLRAWMPPGWALAGALGCALLFAPLWLNSYWGGSFAAAGGGLLFGSIPRLLATRRVRYAWLGMAGWAMGWFARPFEALVIGGVVAAAALVWLVRTRDGWIVRGIGVPALSVGTLCASFTAYYNYRVTGDPFLLPYQAGQAVYGFPQSFAWQEMRRPAEFRTPALRDNFLWQVENRQFLTTPWNWAGQLLKRGFETWKAFWGVPLLAPVAVFLAASRDRGRLFLIATVAAAVFANSFYSFFFPHYFAALAPVFVLFAADGIRRIAAAGGAGRVAALGFTLFCVFSAADLFGARKTETGFPFDPALRQRVLARLEATPGKHLVLVNYAPDHVFHFEWCYNGADIDGSKVVWANRLSPERDRALRAYFRERRVWIVDADSPHPEPRPFEP